MEKIYRKSDFFIDFLLTKQLFCLIIKTSCSIVTLYCQWVAPPGEITVRNAVAHGVCAFASYLYIERRYERNFKEEKYEQIF